METAFCGLCACVRGCVGAREEGETQTVNNKYKQQADSIVVRMLWGGNRIAKVGVRIHGEEVR